MRIEGTRVLVTGAGGFIGSHLAEALVRRGAEVRALVRYGSRGDWGWLESSPAEVKGALDVHAGDIRDPHGVREVVRGCDLVMHLAALIGIPYSYQSPDSYVDTNVRGQLNVLQACREEGVARLVVTSTSEVYGTAVRTPIDEGHPLQGQSPYSASKIAGDKLAEAFHKSFELPVVTARPFNTYGPRQSARAFIPTVITQLLAGSAEVRLGSLAPTRDLNYVEDTVEGFMALAECDAAVGREVNIGSGVEVSVGDVARTLVGSIAPGTPIVTEDDRVRPAASEVERLVCDPALMRQLTGFEPATDLAEGLRLTVEWFSDPANLALYRHETYAI